MSFAVTQLNQLIFQRLGNPAACVTINRVRHRVCFTDPWPDPSRPKSSTRWYVTRRPGSNTGVRCGWCFAFSWFAVCRRRRTMTRVRPPWPTPAWPAVLYQNAASTPPQAG